MYILSSCMNHKGEKQIMHNAFERMERLFAESEQYGITLSDPIAVGDISDMSIEEWTEKRREGIGGSDAGTILGVNHWGDPEALALDKLGMVERTAPDWKTQARFDAGHVMETVIAKMFAAKMGFTVFTDNTMYRHSAYPFMLADCDAFCYDNEGMTCGLEFKYINPDDLKFKWHSGIYGMPETGYRVGNESYVVQVRHYMAVRNLDRWYICVWGGNNADDLVIIRVDRDFARERELIEAEAEFWNNLQDGILPNIPTHTKENLHKIISSYASPEESAVTCSITADSIPGYDLYTYASELNANNKTKSALNKQLKQLEERNHELMKPFIGILCDHGTTSGRMQLDNDTYYAVSYKRRSPSASMNYEKLQLQHPDIMAMLKSEGILTYNVPKPTFTLTEKKERR